MYSFLYHLLCQNTFDASSLRCQREVSSKTMPEFRNTAYTEVRAQTFKGSGFWNSSLGFGLFAFSGWAGPWFFLIIFFMRIPCRTSFKANVIEKVWKRLGCRKTLPRRLFFFHRPLKHSVSTGGDAQQASAKGSDFRAEAPKGSHFWNFVSKGSRFSCFSGFGAKGSQFLNTGGKNQKIKKPSSHCCCILSSWNHPENDVFWSVLWWTTFCAKSG